MSIAPQVLAALSAAASPDQQQRLAGEQQLEQLKHSNAAFLSACTEVFVSADCPLVGRQLAGLQLKNTIIAVMNSNHTHPMSVFFLSPGSAAPFQQSVCLQALQDPQRLVRNVAASIVSWAVYGNLWAPDHTIGLLMNAIAAGQQQSQGGAPGTAVMAVQGAMRALSQIVSDCVLLLESKGLIATLVQGVLPLLTAMDFFSAEFSQLMSTKAPSGVNLPSMKDSNRDAVEVRNFALDIVTTFLDRAAGDSSSPTCVALRPFVGQLMHALLQNVQGLAVNRYLYHGFATKACACLVGIQVFHVVIEDAVFQSVLHTMFEVTASSTDEAANRTAAGFISENEQEKLGIEATGFWGTILNVPRFAEQLQPALAPLIYHLIRQMKYSDFEMGMLSANANDWNVPDKIDDVRPRHYEGKTQSTGQRKKKGGANGVGNGDDPNGVGAGGVNAHNGGDDADDDDDDDGEVKEWNLRRVSAATLDELAEYYGERVIVPVLECIEGMMQPGKPWKDLEAAVLAFGAICDGCFDSLDPYLPTVATRLVQILENSETHFLVVNTTLWALTQIGRYFVRGETKAEKEALHYVIRLMLAKMQSPSKLTQESAAEAVETMVNLCGSWGGEAVAKLEPVSSEILSTIATCISSYQLKNQVLLFEVLQSVCDVMGDMFRLHPDAAGVILKPLGDMWSVIPNDNPLVFAFFSCMGTVCAALGAAVQPMAQQVFDRAFLMVSYHAQIRATAYQKLAQQRQSMGGQPSEQSIYLFDEVPDENYLITAADLLSGLFDALGSSLEPLVAAQQPTLMQIVLFMLTDAESDGVRQCGFAILGDLSKSCVNHVQSALSPIIQAVVQNIDEHAQRRAEEGGADSFYPVLSNMAWFLCSLLENQLEIHDMPTLATLTDPPMAVPRIFHGLTAALCALKVSKASDNAAENIVLCLGMLLYSDAELESKSQVPVTAFAAPFITYMLNIRDLPHRGPALQGFLLCVQNSPNGLQAVLSHLTLFFDLAVRMRDDSPDSTRAMKQILQSAKQQNLQVWSQKMQSYGQAMRTQLYQIYRLD